MSGGLEHFDVVAGRGIFRPTGCMPLAAAVKLVTDAISHARSLGIGELLVNGSAVTGFAPPSLTERFFMAEKWARAGGGTVRLALVVRPEMIDSGKFGVTVALNRGLVADVFPAESEAVAWLDRGDPPSYPGAP